MNYHTYEFITWSKGKQAELTIKARSLTEALEKMTAKLQRREITAYKLA